MNAYKKTKCLVLFLGATFLFSSLSWAQDNPNLASISARDRLKPPRPGTVQLAGYLGRRIDQCINHRIMVQDVGRLLSLFQTKERDPGGYQGEFIGKWLAGAALAARYQPDPALIQKMVKAAQDLIASRAPDGYISTYKPANEFRVWDVWIQKYVLLGLIAQYDQTGNKEFLQGAMASADHLLSLNGPGKLSVEEYGPSVHRGGVNYSILEPIVLLYERTGEKRYLDFARYIVDSWSKPSKYTQNGVRLIENAEAGRPPVESDILHAYVYMSCFEGLAELYRATGEPRYLDATVKAARAIMKHELMIVGSVANQEMWCDGAVEQTEIMEKPVETCATATWMKLCCQLLRLTGDPQWADQLEISLYNALLGAMMPEGEWWCYESPLAGERVPSRVQGVDISCCVSSGPRGLLITPQWGMMSDADGNPVINLYSQGTASFRLASGKSLRIAQETSYPVSGLVSLTVAPETASSFALKLRIPEWSKQTILKVNGEAVACTPGSYAIIRREWKPNDKVTLELDMRGRIIRAPSGAPQQAIMRGPVVLALDNRLTAAEDAVVWLIAHPLPFETPQKDYVGARHNFPPAGQQGYIDLEPVSTKTDGILMAFKVPFWQRVGQFTMHRTKDLILCDYASAGNQWRENSVYRIWLPQPMFLGNIYVRNTYKLMVGRKRPTVPEYIQKAIGKTAPQPITIHNDVKLAVRIGASREVMHGVQPFLYSAGNGVLLVQSQLSEKPLGNRPRINHYPWQFGNRISRDYGEHWADFVLDPEHDEPFLEGGGLCRSDGTVMLLDTYITPAANPDEGEGDLWLSRDALRTIEKPVPMKFHIPGVDFNASKDDGGHEHRAIRLHRSLLELPGGDLLATCYGCFKGDAIPCPYQPNMKKSRSILFRSRDGGRSWDYVSTIAVGDVGSEGFDEPVLCRLARGPHAGRLICLMRTGGDLHLAVSDDEGKTWSAAKPVVFPGIDIHDAAQWKKYLDTSKPHIKRYPVVEGALVDPDLVQLANGILVCAVGVRIPEKGCFVNPACPRNGNYLAFSRDGGETWSHVVQLTSGVSTTHYMALREIRPNQLYVTYDLGFWGRPDNRVMGCTVDVSLRVEAIKGNLSK